MAIACCVKIASARPFLAIVILVRANEGSRDQEELSHAGKTLSEAEGCAALEEVVHEHHHREHQKCEPQCRWYEWLLPHAKHMVLVLM